MNIFILSENPTDAAKLQCDKHVPKMVLESAQMLSTAHRMLDGNVMKAPSKSGKRMVNRYVHPDPYMDEMLYNAVHFHHPCTVWTMKTTANYRWHFEHFIALCNEYTYRYGKTHLSDEKLRRVLAKYPANLPKKKQTSFPLAMASNPECIALGDPVLAYRAFYQTKQNRFKMVWTKREIPEWFVYNEKQKELLYG
jgi:hypothetical protein